MTLIQLSCQRMGLMKQIKTMQKNDEDATVTQLAQAWTRYKIQEASIRR